ncbi:MAG: cupin-like domain-containing protein [Microcoleus sp. SIO2G3]|nr:cupin-like domain-containing protein [Microcoleus sp. SIO2G3]
MQTESKIDSKLEPDNSVKPLSRVPASSLSTKTFFEEYQKEGIPVIITGLLESEPEWNLDYLCEKLSNHEFRIRFYGRDRYKQDKRTWTSIGSAVEGKTMLFTEYADLLRSHEAYEKDVYLGKCPLEDTPLAEPSTLKQAEAHLGLRMPATGMNLWVGPGGHTTCLHCDAVDSTLMQLHGAKKILLFPPSQLYNIYPFPIVSHLRHGLKRRASYSQVYPEQPDFEAFPRFKQALEHRREDIVKQGEMLYIPAGWWHEVTSLGSDMVCSINRFWHVYPVSRALRWSKWRIHLGSVCAAPYILGNLLAAISSGKPKQELSKLVQKL